MPRSNVDTARFLALMRAEGHTEADIGEFLGGQGYRMRKLPDTLKMDLDIPEAGPSFQSSGTPLESVDPTGRAQASGASETDVILTGMVKGGALYASGAGFIPGVKQVTEHAVESFVSGTFSSARGIGQAYFKYAVKPIVDYVVAPAIAAAGYPDQADYAKDLQDLFVKTFDKPTVLEGTISELRARRNIDLVESGNAGLAFLDHGLNVLFDIGYTLAEWRMLGGMLPGIAGRAAVEGSKDLTTWGAIFKAGKATALNAAKVGFKKAWLTPGETGIRAEQAAMTFLYLATPAVAQAMPTDLLAILTDIALNMGISKYVGDDAYESARQFGASIAASRGRPQDAGKYSFFHWMSTFGSDVAYSLQTRSVAHGHHIQRLQRALRNDSLTNNLRDIVDARVDDSVKPVYEEYRVPVGAVGSILSGETPRFESFEASRQTAIKRWVGNSQIVDGSGNPKIVYHGLSEGKLERGIFDKDRLGKNTGAKSAKEGFFFAGDIRTASSYGKKDETSIGEGLRDYLNEQYRDAILEMMDEFGLDEKNLPDELRAIVDKKFNVMNPEDFEFDSPFLTPENTVSYAVRDTTENMEGVFSGLHEQIGREAGRWMEMKGEFLSDSLADLDTQPGIYTKAEVAASYLKIDNPAVVDMQGKRWGDGGKLTFTGTIKKAKKNGHDGVILKNVYDGGPLDDVYVAFEPEQIRPVSSFDLPVLAGDKPRPQPIEVTRTSFMSSDDRTIKIATINNVLGTGHKGDKTLSSLSDKELDGEYRTALERIFFELGISDLKTEKVKTPSGKEITSNIKVSDVPTERLEKIAERLFTDEKLMADPDMPWYKIGPDDFQLASFSLIQKGDKVGDIEFERLVTGQDENGKDFHQDVWRVEVNKGTQDKTTFNKTFFTEKDAQRFKTQADIRSTVSVDFLENVLLKHQKKIHSSGRLGIVSYFTPGDETMRRLGMYPYIGRPARFAMMLTHAQLEQEITSLRELDYDFKKKLTLRNDRLKDIERGDVFGSRLGFDKEKAGKIRKQLTGARFRTLEDTYADIWHDVNGTGKLKSWQVEEKAVAKELRIIADRMWTNINKVRKEVGAPPIPKRKNYIFHLLKREMLSEIEKRGSLSPGLSKLIDPDAIVKNKFLATGIKRVEDIPTDWFVKDPFIAVRAMLGIDLKYIHMEKALHEIKPYVKAVNELEYVHKGKLLHFQPGVRNFVKNYEKYGLNGHKSMFDENIDDFIKNQLESPILGGAMNFIYKKGARINHWKKNVLSSKQNKTKFEERDMPLPLNPWESMMDTMISLNQTGLLGMRIRPALRNLLQQSFDIVLYGYEPWGEAMKKTMSPKWWDEAKKNSITLQSRMPIEGLSHEGYLRMATNKVFRWGSAMYRGSDYVNTLQAITTRHWYATNKLGMTEKQAWQWADDDLPMTQWSYKRVDLPPAYWTTSGRALWQLGSWWMNYYTRFIPEVYRRTFHGVASDGRKVLTQERVAGLRLVLMEAAVRQIANTTGEILGTAIDYTSQFAPDFLQLGPISQMADASIQFANGFASGNDRQFQEGYRGMMRGIGGFVPFFLSGKELLDSIYGDDNIEDVIFMTRDPKKKKGLPKKIDFLKKNTPIIKHIFDDSPKFGDVGFGGDIGFGGGSSDILDAPDIGGLD